ncbi:DUF1488 family protein [Candidatus Erwinia dacicola]|uniref:DUF1488 family protein n=1 Tax=Candidatus Erwinia dacicola TaxID=252393 RepID=UPI001FDF73A6|nr:DUF1488 family protein [Candidatus Erwinia dacicola]
MQFPEREWWDENLQAICFSGLVNGFQLTFTGKALACFHLYRWELEEDAELAIKG